MNKPLQTKPSSVYVMLWQTVMLFPFPKLHCVSAPLPPSFALTLCCVFVSRSCRKKPHRDSLRITASAERYDNPSFRVFHVWLCQTYSMCVAVLLINASVCRQHQCYWHSRHTKSVTSLKCDVTYGVFIFGSELCIFVQKW